MSSLSLAATPVQRLPDMKHGRGHPVERLGLLVDAEWLTRNNARLKRNIKEAHLKLDSACLEDLDYDDRRVIDKPLIRQLATCQWVARHQNITITGATGVGKTFVACASPSTPCVAATGRSTAVPRGSSTSSPWPAPTVPTQDCSRGSPASTS